MKTTLIMVVLGALLAAATPGRVCARSAAPSDTLDLYETRHHLMLEAPQRLWKLLIYPLGRAVIYAEHEELPQRAKRRFTNEAETFGLFPYGQLGGETGTGRGVRTFHTDLFGSAKELNATAIISGSRRQTATALYHDPNVRGGRAYGSLQIDYLRTDHENATANGGFRSVERAYDDLGLDDEDLYLSVHQFDAVATAGWRPHAHALEDYQPNLYLEARLGYGVRELGDGPDLTGIPAPGHTAGAAALTGLGHTAAAAALTGLGRTGSFLSLGARVAYDDRDRKAPLRELSHPLNYVFPGRVLLLSDGQYHSLRDIAYAECGGLLEAQLDWVRGNQDIHFLRLSAEAQRFFTLFRRDRILAVRVRLDQVEPVGNDGLAPFTDLPALGGGQRLRGYERGYFRGEGALLFSVEYRYPIWDTWNAYLFWDEGQVFDDLNEMDTDGFRSSAGAGLSVRSESGFIVGLRAAHSKAEDVLWGFSLEQEF